MTITQKQFDALVGKLEDFSKNDPKNYRLRVAMFAVLGYAYIFLVFAGLLALIGLVFLFAVFINNLIGNMNSAIAQFVTKIVICLLIPVGVIIRSLWVTFKAPQGLKLTRHQVPHLFTLVDELTSKLQASQFHNILLNQEFNAAVVSVPRLGIFGWHKKYLLLGLPLMQSLSLEQFKAVLAHELGHLSGKHDRFGAWIYRIRETWMQLDERLHQENQDGVSSLFNDFLDWYWPLFNAYSFVLVRMNEYEADRCAAQLAGVDNAAEALMNIEVKARFLENSFWTDIGKQVEHQVEPPDNVYSSMLSSLNRPIAQEKSKQWLEEAFIKKTDNADTHPCLTERLKSLGYSTAQAQKLFQPGVSQTTAAEYLLGEALNHFIKNFNQDWKETASTPWRQRYAYLQETKSQLQALEEKTQTQTLTEQEVWERAYYTLELRGDEAAVPLLQDVLKKQPAHPEANYILGQVLLQKADVAGITYIEKAITQRTDWLIDGCELVYSFLSQKGQTQEAQKYRRRAEQHYQLMLKAQQERERVTAHDRFKSHSLDALEVNKLKQQVAGYSQIKEAYLVEKVVTYFPEEPFCVLGIVRQRGLMGNLFEGDDAVQKLIELLATNLQFPTQAYIVILNHSSSGNLKKKIGRIDRSLLFRR